MITMFTFLLTIAAYHLLVGMMLISLVWIAFKFIQVSPETKSWIWTSIFVLSTLLPMSILGKDGHLEVSAPLVTQNVLPDSTVAVDDLTVETEVSIEPLWHVPSSFVKDITMMLVVLCSVWALGTVWRGYQVVRAAKRSRQLLSQTMPSSHFKRGFKGYPIMESQHADSPMIMGIRKPLIILPLSITKQLDETLLIPILLHEVAHIQRKDMPISVIQELLAVLFWWSPIIRFINQKIHLNRELSCDLRAASQLDDPKHYAQSLLEATRMMILQRKNVLAMGLFSKKGELNSRINTVLNAKSKHSPNRFKIAAICLVICSATLVSANQFGPGIDIESVKRDANHYSELSEWESDRIVKAMAKDSPLHLIELIKKGMNINVPIVGDGTPLIIAVRGNNKPMAKALIENGADVNQSAEGDGNPLIEAAKRNYVDLAQLLIQQGADVNAVVTRDETPLIQASWNGHKEMVEYLVENGADVNLGVLANPINNPEWRSPLNKAATAEIREYLIRKGATEQ